MTSTDSPMAEGRRADSARRRQRVIKTINDTIRTGGEMTASAIARAAGVDRSFLYRHRDLLTQIHSAAIEPTDAAPGQRVSRASLQADLANSQQRLLRQAARIRQLETTLSKQLGEQAWRESGLGAPDDIDALKRRILNLEQQVAELTGQLEECQEDLDAARTANRDLMAQLNSTGR